MDGSGIKASQGLSWNTDVLQEKAFPSEQGYSHIYVKPEKKLFSQASRTLLLRRTQPWARGLGNVTMKTWEQQGAFPGLEQGQPSSASASHPSVLHHTCLHSPCWVIDKAFPFVSPPLRGGCSEQWCPGWLCPHTGVGQGLDASSLPLPAGHGPAPPRADGRYLCSCLNHHG